MSEATSLSEPVARSPFMFVASPSVRDIRVTGGVSLSVLARNEDEADAGRSFVDTLSQRDGYKIRFPKSSSHPEAVIINTGGGVASGDAISQDFSVGDDACLTVATQASERIYRKTAGKRTRMAVTAKLGARAALNWLPQETIVFDRSELERTIDIACAGTSRLTMTETVILGRRAMGEVMTTGYFSDRWRIFRDGRLSFAEHVQIDADVLAGMARQATAQDYHVFSTTLYMAPDADDRLGRIRDALEGNKGQAAASAWNGIAIVRMLAHSSAEIRATLQRLVPVLTGASLPRVWLT